MLPNKEILAKKKITKAVTFARGCSFPLWSCTYLDIKVLNMATLLVKWVFHCSQLAN